jgi:hypothetical protein
MVDNILTNLARGTQGQALVKFMETQNIDSGWLFTDAIAMATGLVLASTNGNQVILDNGQVNSQCLIHLYSQDKYLERYTFNLASVLAMAAAYCKYQQRLAEEAAKSIKARQQKDVQIRRKHRNKIRGR